jgi:hypothetical protein
MAIHALLSVISNVNPTCQIWGNLKQRLYYSILKSSSRSKANSLLGIEYQCVFKIFKYYLLRLLKHKITLFWGY